MQCHTACNVRGTSPGVVEFQMLDSVCAAWAPYCRITRLTWRAEQQQAGQPSEQPPPPAEQLHAAPALLQPRTGP